MRTPRGPVTGVSAVWQLAVEGGIAVATPPDRPTVATLIQLDGSVVVSVARDLLQAGSESDRAAALAAHAAALDRARRLVARILALLRDLDRWARTFRRYAALTGLAALALPAASAARRETLWQVAGWALPALVLPAAGVALRPLIRAVLRRQLARVGLDRP